MIVEPAQRRILRRNRAIASGLLLVMAALLVATLAVSNPGFWVLLIRASAEAALVGGLADWFAVTALFRRPFGLPIPHTAVVPRSKDRIGDGLAAFFERNFLTREIMSATLHSVDPARKLADWMAAAENADLLADRFLRLLPPLINMADDRSIRPLFTKSVREQLQKIDFGPFLGRAMAELAASGFYGALVDDALGALRNFLERKEERFEELVAERHRGWVRKAVDRQVARAIVHGVRDLVDDLLQSDSIARQKLLQAIEARAQTALVSPGDRMKFDEVKNRLFENPEVQAWLASVWDTLRDATLEDLALPSSKVREALGSFFCSVGRAVSNDAEICQKMNMSMEAAVGEFLPWREELLSLVTQAVRKWDADAFSERIELTVGSDLQYIRINGTVVGALVGCLLYVGQRLLQ